MKDTITISGTILFDPENATNKQERQSEWKKVAMVMLEPENQKKGLTEYYAWFVKKRFGLVLQRPLRGAHVTLVNDKMTFTEKKWQHVKKKWDGKQIDITVHVDPFLGIKNRKGNYCDWWLTVPYEFRDEMASIRTELGLDPRPFFGFHMTIGTAVNFYPKFREDYEYPKQYGTKGMKMNEEHSRYILKAAQMDYLNLGVIPKHQKKMN